MTVETTQRQVDYFGNGSTTVFAIPFPFVDVAHVRVVLIDGATITLWTFGVDYDLTGGDPDGELTAVLAPANGVTLHAERIVPYTQPMHLEPNDGFDAPAMEDALDRLTMQVQQASDGSGGGGGGSGGTAIGIANVGTGEPVSLGLVGATYNLRSFKASGTGLAAASDGDSITYTLAGVVLASLNLSDLANRQTSLNTITAASAGTVGHVMQLNASNQAVWAPAPTGGGGEANTVTSAGGTVSLPLAKVGVNIPIRGLTAGTNITLTPRGVDVLIDAAVAGEVNDIKTVAVTGQSLIPIPSKVGLDLKTKGIAASLGVLLSPSLTDISVGIDQTASLTWTGIEKFRGNSIEPASLPSDIGLDTAFFPHISHKVSRTAPQGGTASVRTASFTHVVVPAYAPPNECKTWEWASLILFDSAANDSGVAFQGPENAALYVKSFKRGSAAQWGLVVETQNLGASKSTALFGAEISCQSTGTETYNTSGPLTLYHGAITKTPLTDDPSLMDHGLLIHPIHGFTNSRVTYGIRIESRCDFAAINHGGPPAGKTSGASFLRSQGDYTGPAIDLTGLVSATPALALKAGGMIRFGGASNVADVRYNSASTMFGGTTDQAIELMSGGAPSFAVRSDGLVGFRTGTRTNVGAAGGATPLPATPLAYLPVWFKHPTTGTTTVGQIPIYNF